MRSNKSAASYRIFTCLNRFKRNKTGATAIEYALIAVGVAMAIAVVVYTMGDSVEAVFQSAADGFPS